MSHPSPTQPDPDEPGTNPSTPPGGDEPHPNPPTSPGDESPDRDTPAWEGSQANDPVGLVDPRREIPTPPGL